MLGAQSHRTATLDSNPKARSSSVLLTLLFSHSVMSLWPHGLHHARLPCPSLSPRVCSDSCPLSQWRHPTISCSIALFFSCPQCFPASGSFPVNQFFASGDWSIRASASVFPMNIQGWFSLGLIGLISLLSKGLFPSTTVWKLLLTVNQRFPQAPSWVWLIC